MMIFRKKKKKELEDLGLTEEEIIDFKDFRDLDETDIDEKGSSPTDFEKGFIFHISDGCPICGSDVKGNDYFRYFCENCNVLFDKKDIIESEFGKTIKQGVKKTRLTDPEREELEKKRNELKERVFNTFSEQEKKGLEEKAEERQEKEKEETEEAGEEPEEAEEKEEEAEPEETEAEEEPEEVEAEIIPPKTGLDDLAAHAGLVQEAEETEDEPEPEEEVDTEEAAGPEDTEEVEEEPEEETDEEEPQRREEYDLESPDKIIASNESTKMHKGDCHFVKKINPKNRIYLDSIEQGEEQGYDLCVCLRRLRAMQR